MLHLLIVAWAYVVQHLLRVSIYDDFNYVLLKSNELPTWAFVRSALSASPVEWRRLTRQGDGCQAFGRIGRTRNAQIEAKPTVPFCFSGLQAKSTIHVTQQA